MRDGLGPVWCEAAAVGAGGGTSAGRAGIGSMLPGAIMGCGRLVWAGGCVLFSGFVVGAPSSSRAQSIALTNRPSGFLRSASAALGGRITTVSMAEIGRDHV